MMLGNAGNDKAVKRVKQIKYTAWALCSSLREPTRAEWRATNLFLSANKKPNYYDKLLFISTLN